MRRKCDCCSLTLAGYNILEVPNYIICKGCVDNKPYPEKAKYWDYNKKYCTICALNRPKTGQICGDCKIAQDNGKPTPIRSCQICLIQKASYYNKYNEFILCSICYDNSSLSEQTKYRKNKDDCGVCHLKRAVCGISKDNLTHCRQCFNEDPDMNLSLIHI